MYSKWRKQMIDHIPTFEEYEAIVHKLWLEKHGHGSAKQREEDYNSEDGQDFVKQGYHDLLWEIRKDGDTAVDEGMLERACLASMSVYF